MLSGDFTVVIRRDLGGLGPEEGKPVAFSWETSNTAGRIGMKALMWLVVLLPMYFTGKRENKAILVLLPLALIYLILFFAEYILSSSNAVIFTTQIIGTTAVGCAALVVLTEKFAESDGASSLLGAVVVMAGTGLLAYLTNADIRYSDTTEAFIVYYGCLAFAIVAGTSSTALFMHGRFSPARLLLRLIVWFPCTAIIYITAAIVISSIIRDTPEIIRPEVFPMILIFGAAAGLIAFTILLPFLTVMLGSGYNRSALLEIFGLYEADK